MIRPKQLAAARVLIGWSQKQLAHTASVGLSTVADFERGARVPYDNNLAAIRRALEIAGIEFLYGDEPGVKLRRRSDMA